MTQEFRYSYNVIGFQGENITEAIDRLARLEYDAVEVEGDPDMYQRRAKTLARVRSWKHESLLRRPQTE
ncbi:MAG: hypothetical protein WKF53_11350, partial [Rubrobacter sp.]